MTTVAAMDEYNKQIREHYLSIKNFFQVTGRALPENATSSASKKARSKLSNLTSVQFQELSTDVHEELSRRIQEGQDGKNNNKHLPKSEIYQKRNQARQKLSLLTQPRFDALLQDIIFEIEKRGCHNIIDSSESNEDIQNPEEDLIKEEKMEQSELQMEEDIEQSEQQMDEDTKESEQQVDEDTSESELNEQENEISAEEIVQSPKKEKILQSSDNLESTMLVPMKASIDWSDDDDELEENDDTRKDETVNRDSDPMGNTLTEDAFDKSSILMKDNKMEELTLEIESLKKELKEMKEDNTSNLTLKKIDLASIKAFVTSDGNIPFSLAENFHNAINQFFYILENDTPDINNKLSDSLFKAIFQISKTISEILVLVDIPKYREQVILLKASLSHAITSVRYYSTYYKLLPVMTVNAAISDVAFAFCDLSAITGIKPDINTAPMKSSIPRTKSVTSMVTLENISNTNNTQKEEISPVKPLKITQKVQNNESTSSLSSFDEGPRSMKMNKGLFYSILDSSRPATPSTSPSKDDPRIEKQSSGSDNIKKSPTIRLSTTSKTLSNLGKDSPTPKNLLFNKKKEAIDQARQKANELEIGTDDAIDNLKKERFTEKMRNFSDNNGIGFRLGTEDTTIAPDVIL